MLVSRHLLWFNQSRLTASFCQGLLMHQWYMGVQVPLLLQSVYTLTSASRFGYPDLQICFSPWKSPQTFPSPTPEPCGGGWLHNCTYRHVHVVVVYKLKIDGHWFFFPPPKAFSCFLILHSPLICPTMLHFHWFPLTLASPFCGSACMVIKSVFLDEFSCFITYQISITYALQSAFLSRHSYWCCKCP